MTCPSAKADGRSLDVLAVAGLIAIYALRALPLPYRDSSATIRRVTAASSWPSSSAAAQPGTPTLTTTPSPSR